MVLVGHCTRNDWALAATVAKATKRIGIQTWNNFLMTVQPPSYLPWPTQTAPYEHGSRLHRCSGLNLSRAFGVELAAQQREVKLTWNLQALQRCGSVYSRMN